MPVNSELTEAQVREFGSGPGGRRAASQGAKLRKRVGGGRSARSITKWAASPSTPEAFPARHRP